MHRYHFGPLILASTLDLPELCLAAPEHNGASEVIVVVDDTASLSDGFEPDHVDEQSAYALMLDGESGTATMRHENAVDYVITADLDQVTVRPTPDAAPSTVRHLLIDQVLPRLLEARGSFVLHAAGVETDRGGMLFLGQSGSGKSSLAAAFERTGGRLLGDDCFTVDVIEQTVLATTTYPSLRLLPDAIEEFLDAGSAELSEVGANRPKLRVNQNRQEPPQAGSIHALFVIDIDIGHRGPPAVKPLSARHGIVQLIANSFRFHNTGAAAARAIVESERLLEQVSLYELRYERNYDQLDQVVAAVLSTPEFMAQ